MKPVIYLCPHNDFHFEQDDASCRTIAALAPDYEVVVGDRMTVPQALAARVEVLFGSPSKAALASLPNLKWLQLPSAGCDAYLDRSEYAAKDVILTTANGVYGIPISEHILACFFALMRFLPKYRDDMRRKSWVKYFPHCDFEGSVVGIIGLGDIGGRLAQKCHALGARVLAVKNRPSEKPAYVDELLYGEQGIDAVVRQSDFLALCLPSTRETTNILSRERIFSMKKNAYLVNIGRGTAIDQEALIEALRIDAIAGAALDVMTPEPLPEDHALWQLENCLITAHNSGRSRGNQVREVALFGENLTAYLQHRPMRNVVDFQRGY